MFPSRSLLNTSNVNTSANSPVAATNARTSAQNLFTLQNYYKQKCSPASTLSSASSSSSSSTLPPSLAYLPKSERTLDTMLANGTKANGKPAPTNGGSGHNSISRQLSSSLTRTATLPKRFKEKFIGKPAVSSELSSANEHKNNVVQVSSIVSPATTAPAELKTSTPSIKNYSLCSSMSVDDSAFVLSTSSTASSSSSASSSPFCANKKLKDEESRFDAEERPLKSASVGSKEDANSRTNSNATSHDTVTSTSSPQKKAGPFHKFDNEEPQLHQHRLNVFKKYEENIKRLNKANENFAKTYKYLQQILLKKKLEIVPSSTTAILESVLDVTSLAQSFQPSTIAAGDEDENQRRRLLVNESLASLIKWSDQILLSFEKADSNMADEVKESLLRDGLLWLEQLNKSVRELVELTSQNLKNDTLIKLEERLPPPRPRPRSAAGEHSGTPERAPSASSVADESGLKRRCLTEKHGQPQPAPPRPSSAVSCKASNENSTSSTSSSLFLNELASLNNSSKLLLNTTSSSLNSSAFFDRASPANSGLHQPPEATPVRSIKSSVSSSSSAASDGATSKVITAHTVHNAAVPNTSITQTSTLTTTTSLSRNGELTAAFSHNFLSESEKLSVFNDLDRLALELCEMSSSPVNTPVKATPAPQSLPSRSASEAAPGALFSNLATTFTDDQCSYILSQFEAFAKEFNRNQKSSATGSSSLGSTSVSSVSSPAASKYSSCSAASSPLAKCATKPPVPPKPPVTLHSYASFSHDVDYKTAVIESLKEAATKGATNPETLSLENESDERILSKLITQKQREKSSFIEKTLGFDAPTAQATASEPSSAPGVDERTSEKLLNDIKNMTIDSVDEEEDADGYRLSDLLFGVSELKPSFLLIEESDDRLLLGDGAAASVGEDEIEADKADTDFSDDDDLDDYKDLIGSTFCKPTPPTTTTTADSKEEPSSSADETSSPMAATSSASLSFSDVLAAAMNPSALSVETSSILQLEGEIDKCLNILPNLLATPNSSAYLNATSEGGAKPASGGFDASIFSQFLPLNTYHDQIMTITQHADAALPEMKLEDTPAAAAAASAGVHLPQLTLETENKSPVDKYQVLDLLDVSHLLEYQLNTSSGYSTLPAAAAGSSSSGGGGHVHMPLQLQLQLPHNSNILRGGHIDALIVLATSCTATVVAATCSANKSERPVSAASHISSSSSTSTAATAPTTTTTLMPPATSYAAHTPNKSNFLYQEAFLTTYRTIIEPEDLIDKLIYRYRRFSKLSASARRGKASSASPGAASQATPPDSSSSSDETGRSRTDDENKYSKQAASAARNSLALLVRVLDEIGNGYNKRIVETLANFVFELLCDDELQLARLLRKKLLVRLERKKQQELEREKELKLKSERSKLADLGNPLRNSKMMGYLNKRGSLTLLDFKSSQLAEQMTLIDLNLFLKIELSEILLWSTKQSEKFSPNLTRFTEHFNNISYWARSRILEQENVRDRERFIVKFLKIMKHLRKMNNFNSYLAILSAVDSGPVQRLDWNKNIMDTIKEFSALIDPKCGFKCLREAVAEAQPPCIPHIGLILQDLTFLHIANSDYLPSGNCNFWKRWQQYIILERLRYLRSCNYTFKPNLKIQNFFGDFVEYINEEAQYSLSEQLKPRCRPNH